MLHFISCILSSDAQPSAECCIIFHVFSVQMLSLRRCVAFYLVYSQLRCSAFGGVLYNISCIRSSDAQPSAEFFILFRVFSLRWLLCTSNTVLYMQNYISGKLWVYYYMSSFIFPAYFEYSVYNNKSILFAYSLYAFVTCRQTNKHIETLQTADSADLLSIYGLRVVEVDVNFCQILER
jgi:hypothetical protein